MALIVLLVLLALGVIALQKGTVNIAIVAKNAGFTGTDLVTAVAVALAESGGNAMAYNPNDPGGSYGLWQIDLGLHPEFQGENLYDPQTNANAAYSVWQRQGWEGWSTYKNGNYKLHLPVAAASVGGADLGVSV